MKKHFLLLLAMMIISICSSWLSQSITVNGQYGDKTTLVDSAPIGSIVAWAGPKNKIPKGWRECNGDFVNKNAFEQLTDSIGTFWGGTATDKIKLPDLRGYFLRGVTGNINNDPDVEMRMPSGSGTKNDVGSFQFDAVVKHKHLDAGHAHAVNNGNSATRGTERVDCDDNQGCVVNGDEFTNAPISVQNGNAAIGDAVQFEDLILVRTARENRPKNAYIYWIIRVE